MDQHGLIAHAECFKFKRENPEEWASFGCGPGGLGDWLVPDTMWGLNISEACRIHDWYYRFFYDRSPRAKEFADQLLLENARTIITKGSHNFITRKLRYIRCRTYYFMVDKCGQSSWDEAKSIRDKS
jgi:hypothetical protein